MIDLANFVRDDAQVVEIYICPDMMNASDICMSVPIGWKNPIPKNFHMGQGHTTKFREYHHRDLMYSYDLESDAQKVVRKTLTDDKVEKRLYVAAYQEDVLPSHRFPCTNEITHESEVVRTSYRINNRMYLHHDKEDGYEYLYIRYQHVPNVDVKQMQFDLQRVLRKLI